MTYKGSNKEDEGKIREVHWRRVFNNHAAPSSPFFGRKEAKLFRANWRKQDGKRRQETIISSLSLLHFSHIPTQRRKKKKNHARVFGGGNGEASSSSGFAALLIILMKPDASIIPRAERKEEDRCSSGFPLKSFKRES